MVGASNTSSGTDLRESTTREGHGVGDVGELVVSCTILSVSNIVIGRDILAPKDGGVDFSHGVGAGARNDRAFDAKRSTVAAEVSSDNGDFTVGGDEGRSCESDEENLRVHVGGISIAFFEIEMNGVLKVLGKDC